MMCVAHLAPESKYIGFRFFVDKAALITSLGFSVPTVAFSTLGLIQSRIKDSHSQKLAEVLQHINSSLHLHSQKLNMLALH